MKRNINFDFILLVVVLMLVVIGTVMIYSASSFKAKTQYEDSHLFLKKQIVRVLLGLVLLFCAMKIDYHFIQRVAPYFLVLFFIVLIYVLFGGIELKGSKRSLNLILFIFQPSEIAKYALIIFLSTFIVRKGERIETFVEGLFPCLIITILVLLPILLEPDLGTATIVFVIAMIMLFTGGANIWQLMTVGFVSLVGFSLTLYNVGYQKARVIQYINSLRGIQEPPWQVTQSLISLGNGGFWGLGLGNSRQKYHFLPQPFTDFIFSILGEELGLIGASVVLILFLMVMWRGVRIALLAPDKEGMLLATGITAAIMIYALFNAGIALNLLPITGITMPFISYGGTSLVMNLIGVGILLNISTQLKSIDRKYLTSTNYQKRRKNF